MWKKLLAPVPLLAVLGGLPVAGLGLFLFTSLTGTSDGNYQHTGFLDGMIAIMLLGLGFSLVGSYVCVGSVWAWRDRDRDVVPVLVAAGAFLGGMVGMSLVSGLAVYFPPLYLGALATSYLGAVLASRVERPKRRSRAARALKVSVLAVVAAGALVYVAMPRHAFPGGEAPLEARRAWGEATFGLAYTRAEDYLTGHRAVAARLGKVTAVAPVPGLNKTSTSPGELMGEFTLEVIGERGRGLATLHFMHSSSETTLESYQFTGRFEGGGEAIALDGPEGLPAAPGAPAAGGR